MSYQTISWDKADYFEATVKLNSLECRIYFAYKLITNAITSSTIACIAFLDRFAYKLLQQYYKLRYGERVNAIGELVPNIEYYVDRNGNIHVRRFSGLNGTFKIINGLGVKVSERPQGSEIGEGKVENARKIALEMIDAETEKKLDAKAEKHNNWELAMSKRNYGFNNKWASGLDHERSAI